MAREGRYDGRLVNRFTHDGVRRVGTKQRRYAATLAVDADATSNLSDEESSATPCAPTRSSKPPRNPCDEGASAVRIDGNTVPSGQLGFQS